MYFKIKSLVVLAFSLFLIGTSSFASNEEFNVSENENKYGLNIVKEEVKEEVKDTTWDQNDIETANKFIEDLKLRTTRGISIYNNLIEKISSYFQVNPERNKIKEDYMSSELDSINYDIKNNINKEQSLSFEKYSPIVVFAAIDAINDLSTNKISQKNVFQYVFYQITGNYFFLDKEDNA